MIMDDPLSALDMDVADKIMEKAICDHFKGITRVISTHAIHYLKYADYIYVMDEGRIGFEGTYGDIKQTDLFLELKKVVEVRLKLSNPRATSLTTRSLNSREISKVGRPPT